MSWRRWWDRIMPIRVPETIPEHVYIAWVFAGATMVVYLPLFSSAWWWSIAVTLTVGVLMQIIMLRHGINQYELDLEMLE